MESVAFENQIAATQQPEINVFPPQITDMQPLQSQEENIVIAPVMRKSQRPRKSAISGDYLVYLQEVEYDLGDDDDSTSFQQAMQSDKAAFFLTAMEDELTSMQKNKVWSLETPNSTIKPIGCKWVIKTKRDS
ncbi:hypothetical protein EV2_025159 [Malus domestica]